MTLAKLRLGFDVGATFGEKLWSQEIAGLVRVTAQDEAEAWKIFLKLKIRGSASPIAHPLP
jgi:hypothetical protein